MLRATYPRGQEPQPDRQAGQSLVEFALGLLVLVLVVMGIIDFSRMVFARNAVTNAAREAARYVSLHPGATQAEVQNVAKGLIAGLDGNEVHVSVTWPDTKTVQVEVTYTFRATTALIGRFVDQGTGAGVVLRGRSVMRKE